MLNSVSYAYKPYRQSMIDLHGLSLEDAKNFVLAKVKENYDVGVDSLLIITGRGNHIAKDGERGKIFYHTQTWLELEELNPFIKKIQKNDGSYNVKLNSNPKYVSNFLPRKILDRTALLNAIKNNGIELIKKQAENCPKMLGVLGCLHLYGEIIPKNANLGIESIRGAARKGDGLSQLILGRMYERGFSDLITPKYSAAIYWYDRALKQEDPFVSEEAKHYLDELTQMKKNTLPDGEEFFKGDFLKTNLTNLKRIIETKGVEVLTLGANEGSAEMLGKLGYLYLKGLLVDEKDPEKGLDMLTQAAIKGDGCSQLIVGSMYANGTLLVKSNPTKAMYWYKKASEQQNKNICREANFLIGVAYQIGRGASQNDEKAIQYLKLAASDGHHLAQINLANIYAQGVNIKNEIKYKDDKMSTYWYLAAAKGGNVNAMVKLSERFQNGFGTKQSAENAFLWRKKAADIGDREAQYLVGQHYETGEGVGVNTDIAYSYYHSAFQKGHTGAQVRVGFILIQSKNLDSQRLGIDLIKQAAEDPQDADPDALCILSNYYNTGLPQVLEQNKEKAIKYLLQSAKLGCIPARNICLSQFDLFASFLEPQDVLFWLADLAKKGNQGIGALIIDRLKDSGRHDLAKMFDELINPEQKKNKVRKKPAPKKTQTQGSVSTRSQAITNQFDYTRRKNKNHSSGTTSLNDAFETLSLSKRKRNK